MPGSRLRGWRSSDRERSFLKCWRCRHDRDSTMKLNRECRQSAKLC